MWMKLFSGHAKGAQIACHPKKASALYSVAARLHGLSEHRGGSEGLAGDKSLCFARF